MPKPLNIMPTAYTADLTTESSFADFACQCARQFGATIMQRDEPLSAKLELPEASQYSRQKADEAAARLAELRNLSAEEAEERAAAAYQSACAAYRNRIDRRQQMKAAYEAMLVQVLHWTPPTAEHKNLKQFMLSQLRESIDFDCDGSYDTPPSELSGPSWLFMEIQQAEKDIAYHSKSQAEEEKRTAERRRWIEALLASF